MKWSKSWSTLLRHWEGWLVITKNSKQKGNLVTSSKINNDLFFILSSPPNMYIFLLKPSLSLKKSNQPTHSLPSLFSHSSSAKYHQPLQEKKQTNPFPFINRGRLIYTHTHILTPHKKQSLNKRKDALQSSKIFFSSPSKDPQHHPHHHHHNNNNQFKTLVPSNMHHACTWHRGTLSRSRAGPEPVLLSRCAADRSPCLHRMVRGPPLR